jgi:Flp pilus assembly protein TadG
MQKAVPRGKPNRKGVAIITTTLTLMVLIPLIGLAIDLSILYMVKSRLLSATDAAVLAGARALGQGSDSATQAANARAAAVKFFNANFPADYWGSQNISFPAPAVDDTSVPNYRSITGTASVESPLYFLRWFGSNYSTVAVSARASRRDALVVLVLDRSTSMTYTVPGTGRSACAIMKDDAKEFIQYFAQGRDQVGLVVYNAGAFSYQSRTNFTTPDASGKTVSSIIDEIECESNTASAEALHQAYAEIQRVNSTTRANVIVFMTDGIPNGVTGDFNGYNILPCRPLGAGGLVGVLAQWNNNLSTCTNQWSCTAGLMRRSIPNVTDGGQPIGTVTGCTFDDGNLGTVRKDISRMPNQDNWGNALAGPYSTYSNPDVNFFGSPANLNGVSLPQEITKASANALDNMATTIRSDTTLKPQIYTIGLNPDPQGNDQLDHQLLKKLANDPSMAAMSANGLLFYNAQKTQTHGIYVNAPDATQLQAAFDTIATHIVLRLSR